MEHNKNNSRNIEQIFDFLHQIENLKSTLRVCKTKTGRQESTAEHSWRLALMVMVVSKEINLDIDTDRAIKIALVHDLAEAITGDIDCVDVEKGIITKIEKNKLEFKAINILKEKLSKDIGDELFNLWNEYEECKTEEAKFIKAMDKIETLTQFAEAGYKTFKDEEYIPCYADKHVLKVPELIPMLHLIKSELKEEFKKGNFEWKKEYDKI